MKQLLLIQVISLPLNLPYLYALNSIILFTLEN